MAPVTRKRKAVAPTAETQSTPPQRLTHPTSSTKAKSSTVDYKDDDPFYDMYDDATDSAVDSEASNYNSRRPRKKKKSNRKNRKRGRKSPGPTPQAPELSDSDVAVNDEDEESLWDNSTTAVRSHSLNTTASNSITTKDTSLSIKINGVAVSPAALGLTIADILSKGLPKDTIERPLSTHTLSRATSTSVGEQAAQTKVGFLSLPRELRDKVYRYTLSAEGPIILKTRINFERSAQFLKTCSTVAAEGAVILYGENSFHFERIQEKRGNYKDLIWKEVGFKDVRRFLHDIGKINIGHMKYVSFTFKDANPADTPYVKNAAERQFVNDAVLYEIFRMIGENTMLKKLAVEFCGRAQVNSRDVHFLRALGRMKCNQLYSHKHQYYGDRIQTTALQTLKSVMLIKKENHGSIDDTKVKHVPMQLERPKRDNFVYSW